MRICVVGAGAIGGLLGVKLALSGHELTLVARGAHLEAIRNRGLRLEMSDGSVYVAEGVAATADIRACGPQDLVILGVKAHQLPPRAAEAQARPALASSNKHLSCNRRL